MEASGTIQVPTPTPSCHCIGAPGVPFCRAPQRVFADDVGMDGDAVRHALDSLDRRRLVLDLVEAGDMQEPEGEGPAYVRREAVRPGELLLLSAGDGHAIRKPPRDNILTVISSAEAAEENNPGLNSTPFLLRSGVPETAVGAFDLLADARKHLLLLGGHLAEAENPARGGGDGGQTGDEIALTRVALFRRTRLKNRPDGAQRLLEEFV